MKKLFFFLAFLGFTFTASAQSQKMKERTAAATEYVASAMKMDATHKAFLYESVLKGAETVRVKLKSAPDKNAKKAIHKQGREDLKKELSKKFSKADIKKIDTLMKEYKKKNRAKK